jgi:signal transduction histidine kinase
MTQNRYRILVADDETRLHDFFTEALSPDEPGAASAAFKALETQLFGSGEAPSQESGPIYDLTLCASGTEAVDRVIRSVEQQDPYAVIFLDVRMPPGPDGIWAAERIRRLDRDVEIVVVTAFSDIKPSDIVKRVPPAHKLLYLQKPCYVMEIRHMAASLSAKWSMERKLRQIQSQQRQYIRSQKTALDDARKTLERMQKLDALGMFAGTVAHDFNNIMTAILGHTELALLDTEHLPALNMRMTKIHGGCERAKDLVNRILTFIHQSEPEFEILDPGATIGDVLALIQDVTPSDIRLTIDLAGTPGLIRADATQVHQVVMNLYTNAVHAMKAKGGILSIRLGRPSDFPELAGLVVESQGDPAAYAVLGVFDTGCGMDPDTLKSIFEPYFTTKGKEQGTGLGLSVVHSMVARQGGFVHVTSEPGKGTRFYVFFRLLDGGAQT